MTGNSSHHIYRAVAVCLAITAGCELKAGEGAAPLILAVVVHQSSPVDNVSLADLRRIFTGDLRAWPGGRPVILVQQDQDKTVQLRVLQLLFKFTPVLYQRQLMALEFQGKELPVIKVLNSDDNAIKFVWNVPGAIAVVDAAATGFVGHVKLLKVDRKLPSELGYPLR